jgi:GTP:adenosylcobinamide-phosphate guanylyltransferase
MDAVLTAGGIPLPEEPLYPLTQGHPKAVVDVAGKPMIQWVLDALTQAKSVDNVIVVGLTEKSGLKCGKKMYYVPNQGKIVENLQAGARKAMEINKKAKHVVLVSSDLPGITGEMVDWTVKTAMQTDEDIYYSVVQREVMDKRYPGSKRTFTRLKDMEICGGDLNVARLKFLAGGDTDIWTRITDARKSPLKQAALIGFDTAFLLLTGQLSLERAVSTVTTRLHITGRAIVSPYAEVGMDVDKPHQLEIMRADLKKRLKKAEQSSPKSKNIPAAAKRKAGTTVKAGKATVKSAAGKPAPRGRTTPVRKPTKK